LISENQNLALFSLLLVQNKLDQVGLVARVFGTPGACQFYFWHHMLEVSSTSGHYRPHTVLAYTHPAADPHNLVHYHGVAPLVLSLAADIALVVDAVEPIRAHMAHVVLAVGLAADIVLALAHAADTAIVSVFVADVELVPMRDADTELV
jgi:hypothetical protein